VRLLQDVLDSLTDGVVVADAEGYILHFNPAAGRILRSGPLGAPNSEWDPFQRCFHEDGVTPCPSDQLPLARALRGETITDFPMFIRNARMPGGVFLSVNAGPIRDESGRLAGGVVVFRDITAKRQELAHTELLSAVVEQTADSVVITDREGLIEYVNPALEQTTGFDASELIGKTPRTFRSGGHDNANLRDDSEAAHQSEEKRGLLPADHRPSATARRSCTSCGGQGRTDAEGAENESVIQRTVQQRLFPTAPPPAAASNSAEPSTWRTRPEETTSTTSRLPT
jgi:PAS domain-containing protein